MKANSKPWSDTKIISAMQKRDKLFARYQKSGLGTDKDQFKTSKLLFQKILNREKNSPKGTK